MKSKLLYASLLITASANCWPLPVSGEFDQLELRSQGLALWDGEIVLGNPLANGLVIKTNAEVPNRYLGAHELQLLAQTSLNSHWQLRAGLKSETFPEPMRHWALLSLVGEAATGTSVEITAASSGHIQSLLLGAEHSFSLKPGVELIPKLEIVGYGSGDAAVGSGLSTLEAGVRLRFFYTAQLKPYVGINWITSYGETRELLNAEGARAQNFTLRLGASWAF